VDECKSLVAGLSATDPDPVAVAAFLHTAKGLDKTAIGELLGGHEAGRCFRSHSRST
jgi:hypothetical protein